ncbi:MAG: hypothetical protein V1772_13935 [Chloroflexota bacterium]
MDRNRLKAMDETACGKMMEPYGDRWAAFGWRVREIDGHDMGQIMAALDWATGTDDAPCAIIANTVKGKGVSFMENRPEFHNGILTDDQYVTAVAELEARLNHLREEAE